MNILELNGAVFGSTGKIMFAISDEAEKKGHKVMCASPISQTNKNRDPDHDYYKIGTYYGRKMSVLMSRLTGFNGCFAYFSTKKFIKAAKKFKPDLIHLHNLHDSYINLPMLFKYIKNSGAGVIWTLHDCWAFTGKCVHFTGAKCEKWKTACFECPQYKKYPQSIVDRTKWLYKNKKKWFTGIDKMTVATPSGWLGDMARQSFFKDYPVRVIYSGIDLDIFKPTEGDFRKKYNLEDKHIVLGVAFAWCEIKGTDVFVDLAKKLDDSYQIVLVGTDDEIDKMLPDNIISIHRTQGQQELAEIYTAADVLANPTREETLGLVNLEALACGTPVVTFRTGGSPETVDEKSGSVVECNDNDALLEEIKRICTDKPFKAEDCVARGRKFAVKNQVDGYVELIEDMEKIIFGRK